MIPRTTFLIFLSLLWGCVTQEPEDQNSVVTCSQTWYDEIEEIISIGDGQGHGPDLGSQEWRHAVEYRLGIAENKQKPPVTSEKWCGYVQSQIQSRTL